MKRLFTVLLCLAALVRTSYGKDWVLGNGDMKVILDDRTALISVSDLRTGKVWVQDPLDFPLTVKKVKSYGNTLEVTLEGDFAFTMNLTLRDASLDVVLSADGRKSMSELAYPAPFRTPDRNHYILLTDGEGLMLPVWDQDYRLGEGMTYFCGGGLCMPWMGMLDGSRESGYMAVLDTPFDAMLQPFRQSGDSLISFRTVWLSSLDRFGYDRKMTFHFFDKGGYVAQCKKYREYAWKRNGVETLRRKQEQFPALSKMLGAPHVYVWDTGREVGLARRMKEKGVDKALILWDANHLPYPVRGYDDSLKVLGYGSGGYELFTDLHKRDTAVNDAYPFDGPLRHKHCVYPGKYHDLAARKKDGGTYSNQFGTYACPAAMGQEIRDKMDRKNEDYGHETLFLDVYQANGLYECWNPDHPVTRGGYADAIMENLKLLEEDYGWYIGGEWGADYAVPRSVYAHGMMTLQRPWWGSEIDERGTIYYYGDWRNNSRPSIQVGSRTAGPTYYKYCINEALRVPLFELVYHDAVVTSWRWEDANHHYPELWWKKDLYNILYGTAPLWSIDSPRWEAFEKTFISSYETVCPWLERIAYDELLNHEYVTEDGRIQRSDFSSGVSVVVNFSDYDYDYEGRSVKARSFVIL